MSNQGLGHGAPHLPRGASFGGAYRVDAVLGEGEFSVVYAATHEREGEVALKVLHRHLTGDDAVHLRFRREAAILARLEGEHVVRMLDFVEDGGLCAIALERVVGEPLATLLRRERALPARDAAEIALQVCAALGVAHAHGVVHRDLNPSNILVDRGETGAFYVKVVDFGLCKVLQGDEGSQVTTVGAIVGSVEYMAPEQARGDAIDGRADIYALGAILYEMLVGEPPFAGRTAGRTLTAHVEEAPRPLHEVNPAAAVPRALEEVVRKALAKRPEERYPAARDFATAIATAAASASRSGAIPARRAELQVAATDDDDSGDAGRTMRPDELAAITPELAAVRVIVSAEPLPVARDEALSTAPRDRSRDLVISDEATVVTGHTPRRARGRALWIALSVVAAIVAMGVGLLIGAR